MSVYDDNIDKLILHLPFDTSLYENKGSQSYNIHLENSNDINYCKLSSHNSISYKALTMTKNMNYLVEDITLGGQSFTIDGWVCLNKYGIESNYHSDQKEFFGLYIPHEINVWEQMDPLSYSGKYDKILTCEYTGTSASVIYSVGSGMASWIAGFVPADFQDRSLFHFEIDYDSSRGKLLLFINGTCIDAAYVTIRRKEHLRLYLRNHYNTYSYFDEIRIYDGVCMHTTDLNPALVHLIEGFVPPTTNEYVPDSQDITVIPDNAIYNNNKNNLALYLPFDTSLLKYKGINDYDIEVTDETNVTLTNNISKYNKSLYINNCSWTYDVFPMSLGGQSFTIDGWIYYINNNFIISVVNEDLNEVYIKFSNNQIEIQAPHITGYYYTLFTDTNNLDINKLIHFELDYDHDTSSVFLFMDGKLVAKIYSNFSREEKDLRLLSESATVYLDEVRIFDGVCLHVVDFDPPNEYPYASDYPYKDPVKAYKIIETKYNGNIYYPKFYYKPNIIGSTLTDYIVLRWNNKNWYNKIIGGYINKEENYPSKGIGVIKDSKIYICDDISYDTYSIPDPDEEYLQTNPLNYTVKLQPINKASFNNVNNTFISMAGGSDDYVTLHSGSNILLTGEGNDNVYINAAGGSEKHTIHTGEGNDSVRISSGFGPDYMLIYTGKGNDTISLAEHHHTIVPGLGDDLVQTRAEHNHDNIIVYREGDGNDTIITQNPIEGNRDTLSIVGSAYSSVQSGDNIIITVGKGHITLQGGVSKPINLKFTST